MEMLSENIFVVYGLLVILLFGINGTFFIIKKYKNRINNINKELEKITSEKNAIEKKYNAISIQDTDASLNFLNKLLDLKFGYYLNTFLIANFVNDKDLDKKEIKKLKDDFYLDVSNTLNTQQKYNLLRVFSQKGIELYIHQTFLKLFNDANIKFKNSGSGPDNINKQTLNAIYNQG